MSNFEEIIRELTRPLNGQYPRPWMTSLTNPESARVFIIGKNQAKGYPVERVGHERHLDALFNRNDDTCRGLYDHITGGKSSPTRDHIYDLTKRLKEHGVTSVLETNVVCYSTPMSRDLGLPKHSAGRRKGQEIFQFLLDHIAPPIMIVHGVSPAEELGKVLGVDLPKPPEHEDELCVTQAEQSAVFVVPSLAPPQYNKWSTWAPRYLDRLAREVADRLKSV